jgi:hypothetical protein
MSEQLRKLAEELRAQVATADADKQVKIARVLQAAVGLNHLSRLLGR